MTTELLTESLPPIRDDGVIEVRPNPALTDAIRYIASTVPRQWVPTDQIFSLTDLFSFSRDDIELAARILGMERTMEGRDEMWRMPGDGGARYWKEGGAK